MKIVSETDKDVVVDIRDDPDWIRTRRKLKKEKANGNSKTDRSKEANGKTKRF